MVVMILYDIQIKIFLHLKIYFLRLWYKSLTKVLTKENFADYKNSKSYLLRI